jgi:hypothetical protein
MVPERGLEPPLPCENCDLNAARLPIPPLGHKCLEEDPGHAEVANNEALFILPAGPRFVNATAAGLAAPRSGLKYFRILTNADPLYFLKVSQANRDVKAQMASYAQMYPRH